MGCEHLQFFVCREKTRHMNFVQSLLANPVGKKHDLTYWNVLSPPTKQGSLCLLCKFLSRGPTRCRERGYRGRKSGWGIYIPDHLVLQGSLVTSLDNDPDTGGNEPHPDDPNGSQAGIQSLKSSCDRCFSTPDVPLFSQATHRCDDPKYLNAPSPHSHGA